MFSDFKLFVDVHVLDV